MDIINLGATDGLPPVDWAATIVELEAGSNSMKVLGAWAENDDELQSWLRPHAERLAEDPRKSVASNACKLLERISR